MKILFVWPNKDQFGFKPMNLALLSAIMKRSGHLVDLFDTTSIDFNFLSGTEDGNKIKIFKKVDYKGLDLSKKKMNLEDELVKKLDDFKPDIVGVSALLGEVDIGFKVSGIVKKWNGSTVVVWGNKVATMTPEKVLACKDVDFVCVGEAIEFLPEFAECISKKIDPRNLDNIAYRLPDGKIRVNKLRPYYQNLDDLPFFDWSIFDKRHLPKPFDGKIYRNGDHMISWGCPNQCTYCINSAYRKLYGQNSGNFLRRYSVDRIMKELKYLTDTWGLEFFNFDDEDFCLKPWDYFKELAHRYKNEIGLPFVIMANVRNITREKALLLKDMNCASVSLGIETGNPVLRKNILKRSETETEIIDGIKMLNDVGIRTSGFNMLGIPFETRETVMETVKLNRDAEIRYPNVTFFIPMHGTELRDIAIKNGFLKPDSPLVFQHDKPDLSFSKISEKELVALRERFTMYVKMPDAFYKHIERSEKNDAVGRSLTAELNKIYDECVFSNNGVWNDSGRMSEYLDHLDLLSK